MSTIAGGKDGLTETERLLYQLWGAVRSWKQTLCKADGKALFVAQEMETCLARLETAQSRERIIDNVQA